jgi:iron complex transport system ATP-binding protein
MTRFKGRRLATLSDGERQKLMIAKALAQQTQTILLDEPIAFLDFPSKVEVLTLLRTLARREQKAVLLSIHDLELALQIADRLWVLCNDGQLMEGRPRTLAAAGALDFMFEGEGLCFDRQSLHYTLRQSNAGVPNVEPSN